MTLIAVYNSEGCVGRCDAKCYMGTGGQCTCICGGKNHGAGLAKSLDNTREKFKDWIKEAKREHGKKLQADINAEVWQPSLPFPE